MKLNKLFIIILIQLLLLNLHCKSQTDSQKVVEIKTSLPDVSSYNKYYHEVARFFAALPQEDSSSIKSYDTLGVWIKHQEVFEKFYQNMAVPRFNEMRKFSDNELKEANDSIQTLFYPFSGPDFFHAHAFFPNAKTIIMMGLEKVGTVPKVNELSDKRLDVFFKALKRSLDSVFIWGYFMTNDMNKDFARSLELKGVIPIQMLFLARNGFRVLDVKRITITPKGEEIESVSKYDTDNPWDSFVSGCKILYYQPGDSIIRKLYYFSHDLSDVNIEKSSGLILFLNKQNINVCYLKAASYLMWHFNKIRNVALKNARYFFQSDCGIPYSYFPKKDFDIQLYGFYKRPIGVFKYCLQNDLKTAYKTEQNIKPLNFCIDYGCRYNESNLMFAKKIK